jgi:hypothetical protein
MESKGITSLQKVWVRNPWIQILTLLQATRWEEQMHTWEAVLQLSLRKRGTELKPLRSHLLQILQVPTVQVIPVQGQRARIH